MGKANVDSWLKRGGDMEQSIESSLLQTVELCMNLYSVWI